LICLLPQQQLWEAHPYWAAFSVGVLLKAQHGHKQPHKNVRRN
jgi:hypothetical protein